MLKLKRDEARDALRWFAAWPDRPPTDLLAVVDHNGLGPIGARALIEAGFANPMTKSGSVVVLTDEGIIERDRLYPEWLDGTHPWWAFPVDLQEAS